MEKTVVIQGAIADTSKVQDCINSIRSWFDGKIFISTWKTNNDINLSNVDKIIISQDPGPGPFNGLHPVQQHCNLYRQLIGLKNAIAECEEGLVLKIRDDCLISKDIFNIYEDQDCQGLLSIFKKKIMVGNLMTINPNTTSEKNPTFRVSDWLYLGHRSDLETLCKVVDIINETDYSNSFLGTECILAYNLLKYYKFTNLNLNSFKRLIPLAWDYILNNFEVKNTISSCGIKNIGKWEHQAEDLPCYITESLYNNVLNNYVNNFS